MDHDLLMNMYMADKIILFSGEPGLNGCAQKPTGMKENINKFLKSVNITVRRDPNNFRPRINKPDSQKDREQKKSGNFIY